MRVNVFFDVDDTILCGLDGSLRPHVEETFARIVADGHAIYVWSSAGRRWPDLELHGLRHFVSDCYVKPDADHQRTLDVQSVPAPHFVVDDQQDIVGFFGGCCVTPYATRDPNDAEMRRVYETLREFAKQGDRASR